MVIDYRHEELAYFRLINIFQLTFLRSLSFNNSSTFSGSFALSIDGTASAFNLIFLIPSCFAMSLLISKHESSKCTEHRDENLVGCHVSLCLRTNWTHKRCRVGSTVLSGNEWKEMFSVNCVFLQLSPLYVPATQERPRDFLLLHSVAILNM